jgi:hypothetical protein
MTTDPTAQGAQVATTTPAPSIPIDISELKPEAQAEFRTSVRAFERDLLAESKRLEELNRVANRPMEVTASIVYDANIIVRRTLRPPKKKSASIVVMHVISAALLVVVGVATENLSKLWGQLAFAIAVAGAVILYGAALIKERDNG